MQRITLLLAIVLGLSTQLFSQKEDPYIYGEASVCNYHEYTYQIGNLDISQYDFEWTLQSNGNGTFNDNTLANPTVTWTYDEEYNTNTLTVVATPKEVGSSVYPEPLDVTIFPSIEITQICPDNEQYIFVDSDTEFAVTVNEQPENVSYQWYYKQPAGDFESIEDDSNGLYVPNSWLTNTLRLNNVSSEFNGYIYRCEASNCDSITSEELILNVYSIPTAIIQSQQTLVYTGDTIEIVVEASGESLSYQWLCQSVQGGEFNVIQNGPNYSGTNSDTLNINNVPYEFNNNKYMCKVTSTLLNTNNTSVESNDTELVVSQGLSVSGPDDTMVCNESITNFQVSASGGSGAKTYHWFVKKSDEDEWEQITEGGTNPTYSGSGTYKLNLSGVKLENNGYKYYCKVTDDQSQYINSSEAKLTVVDKPAQPTEIEGPTAPCQGSTENNYSVDNAPDVTNYNWVYIGTGASIINGQNTNSITVSYSTVTTSGQWKVTPSNTTCGEGTPRTLAIVPKILASILTHPEDQTTKVNGTATFSLSVNENATNPAYQWQVSEDNGTSWQDIIPGTNPAYDGETTRILNLTGVVLSNNGWQYRCKVSNDCEDLISNPGKLTVIQIIISINSSEELCVGQNIDISSTLSGGGVISYKWYKNNVPIPNSNTPNLHYQLNDIGEYQFKLLINNNVYSNNIQVKVNGLPEFSANLNDISYCQNQKGILLHIYDPNPNLSYTWSPVSGFEAWSDNTLPYLIVNYGKENSAQIKITAQNNLNKCEKTQNFQINLGPLISSLPDTLEWMNKGDYILVFKPEILLQFKTWNWGTTNLTDFSEQLSIPADTLNYHDFYPNSISNSGKLYWIEIGNTIKDACNARYYYNVPMLYKSSPPSDSPVPSLLIYPNPTSGLVYLRCPDYTGEKLSCQVYDIRGLMLRRLTLAIAQDSPAELDLSGLPSGLYLLRVSDDWGYTGNSRIIIAK